MKVAGGRSKPPEISREALERLLELLDPDPRRAARKYAQLRRRLVRLFEWRGARFPEDLTDETISRVARRLDDGVEIQADDPFRYFCGVAHLVFKELLRERRKQRVLQDPASWPASAGGREDGDAEEDERMALLQECLDLLPLESRELILQYHEGEKRVRIENRRAIAARLGIPLNALRIRVHRIRARLEDCVRNRHESGIVS
jgi:RNA polymerase sigma factor (sigma-70 family)